MAHRDTYASVSTCLGHRDYGGKGMLVIMRLLRVSALFSFTRWPQFQKCYVVLNMDILFLLYIPTDPKRNLETK
jgi:hypothetical protein